MKNMQYGKEALVKELKEVKKDFNSEKRGLTRLSTKIENLED